MALQFTMNNEKCKKTNHQNQNKQKEWGKWSDYEDAIARAWDACAFRLICNLANISKQLERFVHVLFRLSWRYHHLLSR